MARPAQILTRAICDWLVLNKWHVSRNVAASGPRPGGFYRLNKADEGRADIEAHKVTGKSVFYHPNQPPARLVLWLACEVKAGKDVLRDDQKLWLANAEKHGAICIVARSLDDVIERLSGL